MRLFLNAQIQEMEKRAFAQDLSAEILMEAAGTLCAASIQQMDFFKSQSSVKRALILCGPGHNGADGFVIARHLFCAGVNTVCLKIGEPASSGLYQLQEKRARVCGVQIKESKNPQIELLQASDFVIDAMFGVGLSRPLKNPFKEWVNLVNKSHLPVVSIDQPSGLDADRGVLYEGGCICATHTLVLGPDRPGFWIGDGPEVLGQKININIGIPPVLEKQIHCHIQGFDDKAACLLLPHSKNTINKSDRGRTLILAGSPGFWGAGVLSSQASFRTGSGYILWASWTQPDALALSQNPEALTAEIKEATLDSGWRSALIGPGLGRSATTYQLLEKLKAYADRPVVVDADALHVLAEKRFALPKTWLVTPHTGELGRFFGVTGSEVENDRISYAHKLVNELGCSVLLKGFRSIFATPDGQTKIILSGNKALAKAGTGDVLAGLIAGFCAQNMSVAEAACLGAYVHGMAADQWVLQKSDLSMSASDLLLAVPQAMKDLENGC